MNERRNNRMKEMGEIVKCLPKLMSLKEVADKFGVSVQAISYTERMAIWKIKKRLEQALRNPSSKK